MTEVSRELVTSDARQTFLLLW